MKKLPIIFASLAMAIVAGVGIANKSMKSASAAGEAVKYNEVESGKKYFITATSGSTSYYFKPDTFSAKNSVATAFTSIDSLGEDLAWTFTQTTSGWRISAGTSYIYFTNDNNGVACAANKECYFTLSQGSSEAYTYLTASDTGSNNRWLALYTSSSGNNWRCYKNTDNGVPNIKLYKYSSGLETYDNPITSINSATLSSITAMPNTTGITVTASVNPTNSDEPIKWTSSDESVATISKSSTYGVANVSLTGVGSCTFTASNQAGTISKTTASLTVNGYHAAAATNKTVSEMIGCTDADYTLLYNVTGVIKSYYSSNTNMHENGRFVIADPTDDTKTITVYNCSADSTCLVWDSFAGKYNYVYKNDFLTNSVTKNAKIGDTINLQVTTSTYSGKKQLTGRVLSLEETIVHVESISISQATVECYVGASFNVFDYFSTVPASTSYKLDIKTASYKAGCCTLSYADGTFTALEKGFANITVGTTDPLFTGENKILSITILEKDSYVVANSINGGDTVVMVNSDCNKELSGINSSTSTLYGDGLAFTTEVSAIYRLQVVAGSKYGTWAFKTTDDKYLAWSSGNSLKTVDSVTDNSSWTVEFDENNVVTMTNVKDTTRAIWWNNSSPRFATYQDKTANIKFYKVARDTTSDNEVENFASNFIYCFEGVCMADGSTNTEDLVNAWNEAKELYLSLSNKQKASVALWQNGTSGSITEMAVELYEYIYTKYASELGLDNFLNRQIELASNSGMILLATDSSIMIVLIASISLISVGGLIFFLKKRKHN